MEGQISNNNNVVASLSFIESRQVSFDVPMSIREMLSARDNSYNDINHSVPNGSRSIPFNPTARNGESIFSSDIRRHSISPRRANLRENTLRERSSISSHLRPRYSQRTARLRRRLRNIRRRSLTILPADTTFVTNHPHIPIIINSNPTTVQSGEGPSESNLGNVVSGGNRFENSNTTTGSVARNHILQHNGLGLPPPQQQSFPIYRSGEVNLSAVLNADHSHEEERPTQMFNLVSISDEELNRLLNQNRGNNLLSEEAILQGLICRRHQVEEEEGHEICCICLDELEYGNDIVKLDCRHDYHFDCIKRWLGEKNYCPLCKNIAIPN